MRNQDFVHGRRVSAHVKFYNILLLNQTGEPDFFETVSQWSLQSSLTVKLFPFYAAIDLSLSLTITCDKVTQYPFTRLGIFCYSSRELYLHSSSV